MPRFNIVILVLKVFPYKNYINQIIEATEMGFLRPMVGYTLWDRKRSTDIREQLDILNINEKLTQYKINWREHVQTMDENRLPKKF